MSSRANRVGGPDPSVLRQAGLPKFTIGQATMAANRSRISSSSDSSKSIMLLFCKKKTSIKKQHHGGKSNYIQDLPLREVEVARNTLGPSFF